MNYTSISKIRNRIISIIDLILIQYEQSDSNIYGINETKLQQWCYLLKQCIMQKQKIIEPIFRKDDSREAEYIHGFCLPKIHPTTSHKTKLPDQQNKAGSKLMNQDSKQEHQNKYLQDKQQIFSCNKLVQVIKSNQIVVHQLVDNYQVKTKINVKTKNNVHNQTQRLKRTQFEFPEGTLKRFCSITQISSSKFVIAGGCQYQNPTVKSTNISIFDSYSGKIVKVAQLIQQLSSHASVYVEPRIYFVGGKKNEGIITKMCSYFDVYQKQTVEIAALNYGAASMCVVEWKKKYIYKIGGIGQCFGQLNLSPYIQRYSIEEDYWELINPQINQSYIQTFRDFQLYAHSMAYITQGNQMVIFGGFDLNKNSTNFGILIQIKNSQSQLNQNQIINEHVHQIIQFGHVKGLEPGGFWHSSFIIQRNSAGSKNEQGQKQNLYAIQTTTNKSLATKVIKIGLN